MNNEPAETAGRWGVAAYFISSLLAAGPIAAHVAETIINAQHVSNFEGARGYAVVMSVPPIFLFCVLLFWVAYLWIRQWPVAIYVVTLTFSALSVPTFRLIADLL